MPAGAHRRSGGRSQGMQQERPPQAGVLQVPQTGCTGGCCRQVIAGPGERRLAARQQAAAQQEGQPALRMRALYDALDLRAHPLHSNMRQLIPLAHQAAPRILGDGEIQHGGEAHTAQHPQRILAEAFLRLAHTADTAELKIPLTAKGINQRTIKPGAHGVDREIAAAEVLLHIAHKKTCSDGGDRHSRSPSGTS